MNKKLENLKNRIIDLDPNDQLIIVELLIEELGLNNETFSEEEYNLKKSNQLRTILELLVQNIKDEIQKENLISLISKISELDKCNQQILVKRLIELIIKLLEEQKQHSLRNECAKNGHIFSEWKKLEWITEEYVGDLGSKELIEVKNIAYERVCERCKCVEKSLEEPQEVREKRLEEERQTEIKKLEKRLRELKSK